LVCAGEKIKYSKVLALMLMQEVESFCRPMCLSRFKKMEFVALASLMMERSTRIFRNFFPRKMMANGVCERHKFEIVMLGKMSIMENRACMVIEPAHAIHDNDN
jgi:hypothetical protein